VKHFLNFILSIVVIASLVLLINQYAEGVIGDSGKPNPTAIIGDTGKPSPELTQSLLQDVMKIKEEMNILQSKLTRAKEGDNLTALYGMKSVNNLKELFNSLSSKVGIIGDIGKPDSTAIIGDTGKPNPGIKTIIGTKQQLSDSVRNGMIIIDDLQQRVGANNRSSSLEKLRNLSDVVNKIKALLQGDQPEYRR